MARQTWRKCPTLPHLWGRTPSKAFRNTPFFLLPQRWYQMPGVQMTQEETAPQIHVLIHSPLLQKQRYLISCFFPVFSFVLDITCMAKWKKQSAGTWSLSGLYSLVAYLALLSYPLTLFNTNWRDWTKKQIKRVSLDLRGRPKEACCPVQE